MLIIGIILCIFFVLVISLLVKSYIDDIKDLEDRVLQLEKRVNENGKFISNIGSEVFKMKEGEKEMACKKGKGGKRK